MEDYEKDESEFDAEIAAMLNPSPDESDTEEATISAEPEESDTPTEDHTEEPKPETVEISRYKNLQAKMTQATQENAELRRTLANLQAQVTELQQVRKQPEQLSDDDDDLSAVENDYPEIAGPLVKKNKMLEQKIAQLEQMVTGVKQTSDRYVQNEQATAAEKHWSTIRQGVPDYDELVSEENVPEVIEWVKEQAPIIQQGFYQGSADDVITVFNMFKQAKGIPVEKPDTLAAAKKAATPRVQKSPDKPTSNKTSFTREQIAKMSMDEFMKNEEVVLAAMSRGEIY